MLKQVAWPGKTLARQDTGSPKHWLTKTLSRQDTGLATSVLCESPEFTFAEVIFVQIHFSQLERFLGDLKHQSASTRGGFRVVDVSGSDLNLKVDTAIGESRQWVADGRSCRVSRVICFVAKCLARLGLFEQCVLCFDERDLAVIRKTRDGVDL